MCNAIIWFMEAKCVAGNVISPEEISLMLSHKIIVVYTYFGNIHDS